MQVVNLFDSCDWILFKAFSLSSTSNEQLTKGLAMITREDARRLVVEYLGRPDWHPTEDDWIVVDEATIEKPWGWVFFHTSKLWRETRDIQYAVAGNSPLIVERKGGRILETGTAYPIERYIANYERNGDPHD